MQSDATPWSEFTALDEAEMTVGTGRKVSRTPWSDFVERHGTMSIHEAELYHCNSRISTASSVNTPLDPVQVSEIRKWMNRESYAPHDALDEEVSERMQFTRQNLSHELYSLVMDTADTNELAIELYILIDNLIYRLRNNRLWLDRIVPESDINRMANHVHLERPCDLTDVLYSILYVGFPWRYMAFQGPRGYRRMLIELGERIVRVEHVLQKMEVAVATSLDFHDSIVESILGFDGVETTLLGTTAVLPMPANKEKNL